MPADEPMSRLRQTLAQRTVDGPTVPNEVDTSIRAAISARFASASARSHGRRAALRRWSAVAAVFVAVLGIAWWIMVSTRDRDGASQRTQLAQALLQVEQLTAEGVA